MKITKKHVGLRMTISWVDQDPDWIGVLGEPHGDGWFDFHAETPERGDVIILAENWRIISIITKEDQ